MTFSWSSVKPLLVQTGKEVANTTEDMRHETVENLVKRHIPERCYAEQWSVNELKAESE